MVSALTPNSRPEFNNMLSFIENNQIVKGDTDKKAKIGIIAWSPDRLARNAIDAGEIIQLLIDNKIVDLQFCTFYFIPNPSGLEYLMIEFARAMGYSLRLKESINRGVQQKFEIGKEWLFRPKFGYEKYKEKIERPNGKIAERTTNFLIPKEPDYSYIRLAFNLRLQGKTFKEIADIINKQGFVAQGGGEMTPTKLSGSGKSKLGYLRDPFYYGCPEVNFRGKGKKSIDLRAESIEDKLTGERLNFTPVVTQEEFERCQK